MRDPLLLRGLAVYLPASVAGLAWWRVRPDRRRGAGIALAMLWNGVAVLAWSAIATRADWVRFEAPGPRIGGMPVELWVGWVVLWGALPLLVPLRVPAVVVVIGALAIDVAAMPSLRPLLVLPAAWPTGEAIAIVTCLIPALLLGRWTAEDRRLPGRAILQMVLFGTLVFVAIPAAAPIGGLEMSRILGRPIWAIELWAQALLVPALPGLAALLAFVRHGRGTPFPYDPPTRLVVQGPYAFVSNPMQVSITMTLLVWAWCTRSWAVLAMIPLSAVYAGGLAAWHEGEQLRVRFGEAWTHYREVVRAWVPTWRPNGLLLTDPSTIWVAGGCEPCSAVGRWLLSRDPVGLRILAAEHHPGSALRRMTYEPGDGSPAVEGVRAFARALPHLHLGWAMVGWLVDLPVIAHMIQLVADAVGAGPMTVPNDGAPGTPVELRRRPVPSRPS